MIRTLKDLYVHQIKDMYSAETQFLDALPKLIARATDSELREKLQKHVQTTTKHKSRIEKIFANHGMAPEKERCQAAEGLIKEANHLLEEMDGPVVDAGIVASVQRFKHYEIAAYGTAKAYAKELDFGDDVDLLDETLDEESDVDDHLTKLAVGAFFGAGEGLNEEANTGG